MSNDATIIADVGIIYAKPTWWTDIVVQMRGQMWAVAERQRHGSYVAALFHEQHIAMEFAEKRQKDYEDLAATDAPGFDVEPIEVHEKTRTIYYGGFEDV